MAIRQDRVAIRNYVAMTAKYERIANSIKTKIAAGELQPGDKLPSYGQLQAEHQVSYGSVRAALLVLRTEGVVISRQGDGVFVKGPE